VDSGGFLGRAQVAGCAAIVCMAKRLLHRRTGVLARMYVHFCGVQAGPKSQKCELSWLNPKVGKRDFGTFLARLKIGLSRLVSIFEKNEFSRLNAIFGKKIGSIQINSVFEKRVCVKPAQPKKIGKNWIEPAQLEVFEKTKLTSLNTNQKM